MPQMAPLNWLTLMILFIFILISFNVMNYFSFLYKKQEKMTKKMIKKMINWKW